MTKGGANKKQTKGQRRDELERKRDDRVRRNALKKERKMKEYLEDDQDFASFSNQLEALGLKIKDIPGDGNCLFRALGDQIEGEHTSHARHRRETVKYMRDHRSDFEPFMEDNVSFDKHLEQLSKLSTYGGNDSIVAFARNHGVNIVIHQLNEPRWVIYGGDYSKNGQARELHISYHNGEHYSSVRRINDNTTEPAWVKHNEKTSAVTAPVKPQPSESKKVRKSKEKEKRKDTTADIDNMAFLQGGELTAEELVMAATGCKDLVTIAQTLEDNAYDVDASIHYILQLMCVAEDTGCLSDELYATSSELVNHVPMTECNVLESEKSADMEIKDLNTNNSTGETCSCSTEDNTQLSDLGTKEETENSNLNLSSNPKSETVQDLSESISRGDHKSSKTYEQQGARPKVVDRSKNRQGTSNVHLSNKKRKELAKQEKKKRRDERRKEDSIPCLDSGAAGEQNTSNGIVADLGLLAI
ncbi:OTU domain-containing protein 3-like isoform X2 [Orbicella faveolata]|uniref:OTU domain-containing protein 3-like isoform X1 n=1 Tax=Orbicella faveolata TaxID=48498 RepID=UPI0009E56AC4|nr:OTU domain-containing protein 3-like isoform X1 [Orbicella faveolata]XP_020608263.1 OTU domain-containing protein 3-like isoform X2 [Orbicella faveolata]